MPFTHSRATGISGALRQRAWGSLRADPRYSPATAVIADQKLTSSKQSGTWQERGYQGPKMFGKVLKELEWTGSLSLQVCSVPSGDSTLAVGGVYQGSRCMGLVRHSCLHNGTALQSAPPHSEHRFFHIRRQRPGEQSQCLPMQWLRHCHVPIYDTVRLSLLAL